jgi:hypothetical protein
MINQLKVTYKYVIFKSVFDITVYGGSFVSRMLLCDYIMNDKTLDDFYKYIDTMLHSIVLFTTIIMCVKILDNIHLILRINTMILTKNIPSNTNCGWYIYFFTSLINAAFIMSIEAFVIYSFYSIDEIEFILPYVIICILPELVFIYNVLCEIHDFILYL